VTRLHVVEAGTGFPLVLVHGAPGMDHTHWRPWLEPLADEFRLIFYDQRGHGRSERVPPEELTLERFAQDIDTVARRLELERFAVLGHSFGAVVATYHAIHRGTAAAYVISQGADSLDGLGRDIAESFADRPEVLAIWEREKTVRDEAEARELADAKMLSFFAGEPPPGFGAETTFAPETLRHLATNGFGNFDFGPELDRVTAPTLVIAGELDRTCTPRAARALHAGIRDSRLVILPGAGHIGFAERQDEYIAAVREFLRQETTRGKPPGFPLITG
jgi:proline iminopeptidase